MDHKNTITLSNGIEFPFIGLGTFRTADCKKELITAIKTAIKVGYRHIDGAWLYDNEKAVGEGVREAITESNGQLKREDLFLVSKVWNTFHSKANVRKCLDETLKNLGTDYVDLYLMHWPMGFEENTGEVFPKDSEGKRLFSDVHYLETYAAMEELAREGKIKSIGVSNFNIEQLQNVLDHCQIKPVNNQVEINPYLQNDKLVEWCQKNGIVVSAYGPLGAGAKSTKIPELPILLQNETLTTIAKKYNKTSAQVCIRWSIQRNIVVLPKSVHPERIVDNFNVFDFELTDNDMEEIKKLNVNLRNYGVETLKEHKFYPFTDTD